MKTHTRDLPERSITAASEGNVKVQLTVKIKLLASAEQEKLIEQTMREYISAVNNIVADMVTFRQMGKLSSRSVGGLLPSALKNQCVSDSKSIYKRFCMNTARVVGQLSRTD